MHIRRRDAAALVLALVAVLMAGVALSVDRTEPPITFEARDGLVYVSSVNPFGGAAEQGARVGMVAINVDGQNILNAPAAALPALAARGIDGSVELVWPEMVPAARQELDWIARQPVAQPTSPSDNPDGSPISYNGPAVSAIYVWTQQNDIGRRSALFGVALGLALLVGGIAWLRSGRGGESMRQFGATLPVATAIPLFALPWALLPSGPAVALGAGVQALAMMPLALDLSARISPPAHARRALLVAGCLAVASVVVALGPLYGIRVRWSTLLAAGVAATAAFVPGALAAWPVLGPDVADSSAPRPGRFVDAAELVMAAAAPGVAALSMFGSPFPVPTIVLWIALILAARRFTLRPLARLATRATLQRDAIVAATEAERARIAADIHDDALQDLTMLIRRLDAAGDAENAGAAREVASRLRAICGELRLPILDDLGLGPALEWLTDRFEQIAPGPVYLERLRDEPRLPRDVELAVFRICQEALTNAVKHGRPPIVVRYRTGGSWAELEVDDAGGGLAAGAADRAEAAGHFGLLNMAQRAEQVGAVVTVGRRPGGGTRVSVVWEAASATTAAGPDGLVAGAARRASADGHAGEPGVA